MKRYFVDASGNFLGSYDDADGEMPEEFEGAVEVDEDPKPPRPPTVQRFFVDQDGKYIGSYDGPDDEMPAIFEGASEADMPPIDARQVWDAGSGEYLPMPQPPYQIAKTTPWLRMTEDEAAIMDVIMSEATAREKQTYMAAQYLSSDDKLWALMHQRLADNLPGGDARATELLAPEP